MKSLVLILLGSSFFHLQSQDLSKVSREAQIYFEAKNYDHVRQIYEEMSVENLPSWVKEEVHYNLGTTWVAQGEWDKALDQFNQVNLDQYSFPLLAYHLKFNSAYAHWQMAIADEKNLKAVIYHLGLMAKDVEIAQEAYCQLAKQEGAAECPINLQLKQMKQMAEDRLATVIGSFKGTLEDRFFLLFANNMMTRSLRQLSSNKSNLPEMLLKNAIDDQEFALTAGRLNQMMAKEHPEILRLDLKAQKYARADAAPFLQAVYAKQTDLFHHDKKCQKNPWDEVLPLFDQALQNAILAEEGLESESPQGEIIRKHQEKALKLWKEALKKLNESRQSAMQQKQAAESPEQHSSPKINEILQSLQEMEKDDKSTPKLDLGPQKKEARPW